MGIDLRIVPDSFKRCLPTEYQQDTVKRYAAGQEKELQDDIEKWLRSQHIYYTRPRMDKATTTRKGTPDFSCCVERRALYIEVKTGTNSLTKEQEHEMAAIKASKGIYLIARDLESVKQVVGHIQAQMRFVEAELKSHGVNFQKDPFE